VLPVVGALLGLAGGAAALHTLPGTDTAGTALVLLVTTAAGLMVGVLASGVVFLWAWRRGRPAPEASAAPPAAAPAPPPEPPPAPEPPPEPEWPAPEDPIVPGWHPDPAGGGARRFWDGQAWTEHRWRDRKPS